MKVLINVVVSGQDMWTYELWFQLRQDSVEMDVMLGGKLLATLRRVVGAYVIAPSVPSGVFEMSFSTKEAAVDHALELGCQSFRRPVFSIRKGSLFEFDSNVVLELEEAA